MFCHAIIGTSTGKERIMKVDVSAEFISPLLSFSQREVNFCVMKVRKSEFFLNLKLSVAIFFSVVDVFVV